MRLYLVPSRILTDLNKFIVDGETKYFVVLARLGKDASVFLTAYDPRTATEYQCGGAPTHWAKEKCFKPELLDKFQV